MILKCQKAMLIFNLNCIYFIKKSLGNFKEIVSASVFKQANECTSIADYVIKSEIGQKVWDSGVQGESLRSRISKTLNTNEIKFGNFLSLFQIQSLIHNLSKLNKLLCSSRVHTTIRVAAHVSIRGLSRLQYLISELIVR